MFVDCCSCATIVAQRQPCQVRSYRAAACMPRRSRGAMRPRFTGIFLALQSEGAGKTGCALHPRSRVQLHKRVRTRAYRSSGEHPAFPAQWFYGLYVISPVSRALLPPSLRRSHPQSLAPASGARTTRLRRTLKLRASVAASASTAPRPTFVTIASAPLNGTGWQSYRVICTSDKQKYFYARGWTGFC